MRRVTLLPLLLAAPALADEPRDLQAVHYDALLAEHCALVTEPVVAGYRREYALVVARDALSEEAQRQARIAAGVAFDREWANRGLGGARGWCRREGAESAARLAAAASPS